MQAPGLKAIGKCTCKGNPSRRPSTPTGQVASPGGVTGPADKHDRVMIGWTASAAGSPWSKSVDPVAGRPEVFYEGHMGCVCQLEGWIGLRVVFKATLAPAQKGMWV